MRLATSCVAAFLFLSAGAFVTRAQTNTLSVKLDEETRRLLRDATTDHWFHKDSFTSTLLGGVLALAGVLAASLYAHSLQKSHERLEKAEFAANVLRAIRCELEALTDIYDQGIGAHLKEVTEGQIFPYSLALTASGGIPDQ